MEVFPDRAHAVAAVRYPTADHPAEMFKPEPDLSRSLSEGDILSAYRRRIWSLFGAVCIAVFLPGAIFIFVNGYQSLAIAVLCMLGVFALNNISYVRTRAPRLMMALFAISLMAAVGLCLIQRGVLGVLWTFPALLFITFLAAGQAARVYSAIYLVCMSVVMLFVLELQLSLRAITGLIVTVCVTQIFLGMIDNLQRKLVEQSSIDPLTGALNRREMDAVLQDALERKRRTNTPASVLVLDIDDFKSVNDTFGHAVGDRVLRELTAVIQQRARHLDQVFRLGGEEFMVFLPDTPASGALTFAEELRMLASDKEFIDERIITVSSGICELDHGETIDEWLKRADDALYLAKHRGRNCIVEATPSGKVHTSFIPNFDSKTSADLLIG